jgi:16S rRNA (cytosine967-C5)-methyltransferase
MRLERSGIPGVEVVVGDGREADALVGTGSVDVAFVDAPCTGLGTLRRYPEKRWRLQHEDIERLHPLQSELLRAAALTVKPGGCVVYSTCSVARRENDDVVDEFLGRTGGADFTIEPVGDSIPDEWRAFSDARGWFRSWPTAAGPDGHFVAVLRRTGT